MVNLSILSMFYMSISNNTRNRFENWNYITEGLLANFLIPFQRLSIPLFVCFFVWFFMLKESISWDIIFIFILLILIKMSQDFFENDFIIFIQSKCFEHVNVFFIHLGDPIYNFFDLIIDPFKKWGCFCDDFFVNFSMEFIYSKKCLTLSVLFLTRTFIFLADNCALLALFFQTIFVGRIWAFTEYKFVREEIQFVFLKYLTIPNGWLSIL